MVYLDNFTFPDDEQEFDFILEIKRKCYNSFYPFKVLSARAFERIDFESVTILYGGNGCGKTTALNVIANKLNLERQSPFNSSSFMDNYVEMCSYELNEDCSRIPDGSRIITSDDVFDFMLNLRALNEGIDTKREELFEEYLDAKYSKFKFNSMEDYDQLKKVTQARSKTQSSYVKNNLMGNVREHSNGESAFMYFTETIKDNALYLLDEPENSLSIPRQLELLKFLEDSARFFGCQFVISTHSPFLLSMKGAKIYDMDENPVDIKKWTELNNVRQMYEFFKKHEREFE
ncbi:MAG: AAA family ATPase [Lachnospiraceae bacterium]